MKILELIVGPEHLHLPTVFFTACDCCVYDDHTFLEDPHM